jgi:hypothetical protein
MKRRRLLEGLAASVTVRLPLLVVLADRQLGIGKARRNAVGYWDWNTTTQNTCAVTPPRRARTAGQIDTVAVPADCSHAIC